MSPEANKGSTGMIELGSEPQALRLNSYWDPDDGDLTTVVVSKEREGLLFVFEAECSTGGFTADGTDDEGSDEILRSDRCEVFLSASRDLTEGYFGFEADRAGRIFWFQAECYRNIRQIEPPGSFSLESKAVGAGYRVEALFSYSLLREHRIELHKAAAVGIHRACIACDKVDRPIWMSWIDSGLPKADFHRAESFGLIKG